MDESRVWAMIEIQTQREPIKGRLTAAEGGTTVAFTGWVELTSAIEQLHAGKLASRPPPEKAERASASHPGEPDEG